MGLTLQDGLCCLTARQKKTLIGPSQALMALEKFVKKFG